MKQILARLSAETTVDFYLLLEDADLNEMVQTNAPYEVLLNHVNENY